MDIKLVEKFVREIELFRGLTDDEFVTLSQRMVEKTYKVGDFLFHENGPREDVFVIFDGHVELLKTNVYGVETRLAYFGKGDFLGEGSLSYDNPHSTSSRALEPTVVYSINHDFFTANPDATLKIFSNIARIISRRMRNANARMTSSAAQYESGKTRHEHDLLGDRNVPAEAYYGVQTLRAVENFNISGVTLNFFPALIEGLAMVKHAAALANNDLGLMDDKVTDAICKACEELVQGKFHNHFVVDMIQGGAGTSTNMNANEVIANRALEIMGYEKGQYEHCHPNNHVNLSQSTNDAYPTSVKIALINSNKKLIEVLRMLIESFDNKSKEFANVIKMGRTQLQDAVPMTLGQEFGAYAATLTEEIERLEQNAKLFLEVNMGATAIGTGICSDPDYADKVIAHLRKVTGMPIVNSDRKSVV